MYQHTSSILTLQHKTPATRTNTQAQYLLYNIKLLQHIPTHKLNTYFTTSKYSLVTNPEISIE